MAEKTRVTTSNPGVSGGAPPAGSGLPENAVDVGREQIGGIRNLFRKPGDVTPLDGSVGVGAQPIQGFLGRKESD
jgi:hypothetical protein